MLSFFSVMTKTLKFFTALIALTLASPAWAQESVTFRWVREVNTGIAGMATASAPHCYEDGTPLLPNSAVYALFVVPREGQTLVADEIPFSINTDCSVTCGEKVAQAVWANLSTASSDAQSQGLCLGEGEFQGLPGADEWANFFFGNAVAITAADTTYFWPESAGQMPTCFVYAVVFDTRAVNPSDGAVVSVDGSPVHRNGRPLPTQIIGWGAAQVCQLMQRDPNAIPAQPKEAYIGLPEDLRTALAAVAAKLNIPDFAAIGPLNVAKSATLPTAVESADGTILSGADLEAALKPTISGMATTTIVGENGAETPAFAFDFTPAPLPDLSTYTLYTATDLNGPWVPFDEVLKENPLAIPSGMRYTTLRIDGEESVLMTIPRLENDPTRFYRLQGDVEVVTTGQKGE